MEAKKSSRVVEAAKLEAEAKALRSAEITLGADKPLRGLFREENDRIIEGTVRELLQYIEAKSLTIQFVYFFSNSYSEFISTI